MTKKEKEVVEIIYESYIKSGSRSMKRDDLIERLGGMEAAKDLAQLLTYGKSLYCESRGSDSIVQITSEGIEYMENITIRRVKEYVFWITSFSAITAALFSVLNFLK